MADSPKDLEGQLIGSRYRVTARIGAGGMGVVYRALDEQLHRPVAIKFLPPALMHDVDRLGRFRNEARTLSALNHPHIVTVHEIGQAGDAPFITMELVEGETLRERLRTGRLPLHEAIDFTLQTARALAAAHERGVIHRDIKPENVMVRRDGYVKVLDFGLAVLRPQAEVSQSMITGGSLETVAQTVAGTPAYMSPEQIEGAPLDARSDIFSLGVLLCEAATGTNPFARPGVLETLSAIGQTPAPAAAATTDLPREVRSIVIRALDKSPSQRYQSSTDLASDLRVVLSSLDSQASRPSVNRSRLRWYGAAAAIAIGVASVVGGAAYRRSERRHWVREQATPEIVRLASQEKFVDAFRTIQAAEQYLPDDPGLDSRGRISDSRGVDSLGATWSGGRGRRLSLPETGLASPRCDPPREASHSERLLALEGVKAWCRRIHHRTDPV